MNGYESWIQQTTEKIREKISWVSDKNKDKMPYTTDINGDYDDRFDTTKEWNIDDGPNWWTNGFWGGIMWLLYQDTKETRYADIARISEHRLEQCFDDYFGLHHDMGFMFQPTAVADYCLTGNERSKKTAMRLSRIAHRPIIIAATI